MTTAWIWTCCFCAAWIELAIGNLGPSAPVLPATAFALAVAFGWRSVLVPLVLAAVSMDAVLGRPVLEATLAVAGAMALGLFWRARTSGSHPAAEAILGFLLGLGYAGTCFGLQALGTPVFSSVMAWTAVIKTVSTTVLGAVLLPVLGAFQRWGIRFFALNPTAMSVK